MALNLLDENKGCPIDRQRFTWKELVATTDQQAGR